MAAALLGAFAAHQAQSQQPGHVPGGAAAYRRQTLPLGDKMADESGNAPAGGLDTKPRQHPGSSSAKLRSAVRHDIASGNYLLAVSLYLVEKGYSRAAAAGIAACVAGESAGNPESVGSGGGGLIGWTPINSAQPNSNILTGNAAHDMMTQLADILYYNSTEIGQPLVNQLNSISDPVAAADFFSQNFEKPAVTYSDVRASVAQQIFSELGGLCLGAGEARPHAAFRRHRRSGLRMTARASRWRKVHALDAGWCAGKSMSKVTGAPYFRRWHLL